MGKPLPMELRQRVVYFFEERNTHRVAAARFRVSIKFVNDMVLQKRRTKSIDPKPQGNFGGHGKLSGVAGRIERRISKRRVRACTYRRTPYTTSSSGTSSATAIAFSVSTEPRDFPVSM
jgi:hypothetical protein